MLFDDLGNLNYGIVQTPPTPPSSGTSLVLGAGQGANIPTIVNGCEALVLPDPSTFPTSGNSEIVRITGKTGDTLTIARQQAGTSARTIKSGDYILVVLTKKMIADIIANFANYQPLASNLTSFAAKTAPGGAVVGTTDTQVLTHKDLTDPSNTFPTTAANWSTIAATLTYSSADGHTFVVSTSVDLTGVIGVGFRIALTNQAATQYFIVTAITSSTITLYGGTDYTLTNSAITSPLYSNAKAPFGFPMNPLKWMEQAVDTTLRTQSNITNSVWYNPGGINLAIPIGAWRVNYRCFTQLQTNGSLISTTLSTVNNGETDNDFRAITADGTRDANGFLGGPAYAEKLLVLATKTPYYLNVMSDNGGGGNIRLSNDAQKCIINAYCAYL